MVLQELGQLARDVLTVRQVFGEPIDRDGVTVVPVAAVAGGGGGGSGTEGDGAGFGMGARPAGVYVITDGRVRWQPAVDVNRLATAAAIVVGLALLRRRRRHR